MNKFLILAVLIGITLAMKGNVNTILRLEALSDEIVDHVNTVQNDWVAEKSAKFLNVEQVKGMLGAWETPEEIKLPYKELFVLEDLPESFDPREKWPKCESLFEIRDQANCGSCWAMGAAEAMSDRICIASQQTLQTRVSAQDLASCCEECGDGCNGGYPDAAWQYWSETGIVTGDLYNVTSWCKPYALPPCDHHVVGTLTPCPASTDTPECKKECRAGWKNTYENDKTYGQAQGYRLQNNEKAIQTELFTNGPVEVAFTVYADFPTYKSGVYHHTSGSALGGHAVKLMGWGVENGTPYWLVANSWNMDWASLFIKREAINQISKQNKNLSKQIIFYKGFGGYFKIRRGNNECGIEDEVVSGLPKL